MARAATSRRRNFLGFGKRKPVRKRKASAKTKRRMFGWLTDKKETYRRDVAGERADMARRAKAEKSARVADSRRLLEELKEDAYSAGQNDKQRGQKLTPYRLSLITSPRYEEAFGKQRARQLVTSSYKAGHRQNPNPNPCARTVKASVTDRAKRYRANQKGCLPNYPKKCKVCGSKSDVMVDHIDGNESNGKKSNLRWLCRSCNNTLGAEMAKAGEGRRTVQYNPAHKGALTLGEYMQAVLQHTRGAHDAAGKIIHDTPKSRRREFASEIWARREAHGTARPGSASAGYDEPDWVTNPRRNGESSTEYRLGYNLGQMDKQNAALPKTPGELYETFAANFGGQHPSRIEAFHAAYQDGYGTIAGGTTARNGGRQVNGGLPKRNPNGEDAEYAQAKKIAELFHGRPVKEEITVTEHIREHDWLWRIGPLVKLKVRTVRKQRATFPFSLKGEALVHLFSSPDGRQMYLRGGDQEISLEALGMDGEDWHRDKMVIGEVTEITYRDQKAFHSFKTTEYFHKLGEVSKVKPWLVYDTMNQKLEIVGGQYYVETKELVEKMSPGLVN